MITFENGKGDLERITIGNDMTQVNHFVTGSDGMWEFKGKQMITKENPLEHCLYKLGVVKLRNGLPLVKHKDRVKEIRDFYIRNKKGK